MSDGNDPYLFDVGIIALAHTANPVREIALAYVRDAIAGEIDAVVPYPAVVGAHEVLTTYYGVSNPDASRLMQNFMDAKRINWVDEVSEAVIRSGFSWSSDRNVNGWDGYYGEVAIECGVNTVLTIGRDFERFEEFETKIILSAAQFRELDQFLGN